MRNFFLLFLFAFLRLSAAIEENPLKGFSTFLVVPMIPLSSKSLSDKINILLEKELAKYGKVSKVSLVSKTKEEEVIDFSQIKTDAILIYEIENVTREQHPFIKASLNLKGRPLNEDSRSSIWSDDCSVPGSTEKDVENLVAQTLSNLLQKFVITYSAANFDKPLFKLYTNTLKNREYDKEAP